MFFAMMAVVLGWWFYALSRLCFWVANTYISFISSFILVPLGHPPLLALKQPVQQQGRCRNAIVEAESPTADGCRPGSLAPIKTADMSMLHTSISDLQEQMRQLQQSCISSPTHQDHVQRWFANTAASEVDGLQSDSSCLTVVPVVSDKLSTQRTMSCAAAAAAMALCGQTGIPAGATVAAVGTAAMLAKQLSHNGSDSSNSQQRKSTSSCCTVPPLTYEISDEQQRELDDAAPSEFLCPLSRVLMTDPVCTPSGFTYQRSSIEEFIIKTGHDPAREQALIAEQLYPNIVLRDQIASWLQKHGVAT